MGSWRSSQEALPETARLRVDIDGWGSKREKYKSSGLSGGARASGVLDIKEGLEGKEEGEASSICLKISGILGSAKGREQYWGTEKERRP